jgi:hypothetical protein
LAVTTATVVARRLGAPSIYSARINSNAVNPSASAEDLADLVPSVDIKEMSRELV